MITIDGSQGEGGGQILRTSLALAMVTGQPFVMRNIRAGRQKPGLMRQHLTAVRAATEVCGATVSGDELGSKELTFTPGKVKSGTYEFKVGTAGSTTLVLQTVLPALLVAEGESAITLFGGTHNPFAPPYDFLERTFFPQILKMGASITSALIRPGFYPAGGGSFRGSVVPAKKLEPIDLLDAGDLLQRQVRVMICNLPMDVATREMEVLRRKLTWDPDSFKFKPLEGGCGPGNTLVAEIEYANVTEVITGFGQKGVTSEAVAHAVISEIRRYLAARVPVGEHLADQLMIPLAMARGGAYKTMPLSRHSLTNIDIIRKFLDVAISVEPVENGNVVVRFG